MLAVLRELPPLALAELLLAPRLLPLDLLLQFLEVLLEGVNGAYLAAHIVAFLLQRPAIDPLPLQLLLVLPHDVPQLPHQQLELLPQSVHGHPHRVLITNQPVQPIELEVVGGAFELYFSEFFLDLCLGAHHRNYEYNLCENNEYHSPGSDAEQQVGQLRDVLRVRAVAVEEVPLFDELPQLAPARAVVVSGAQLYQLVADRRTRNNNDGDFVFHAELDLVSNVKDSIGHQDTHDLAAGHSLGALLALCHAQTEVHLELHLSAPTQVLVRVV